MNALSETKDASLPPGSQSPGPESIRLAQLAIGDALIQGNDLPQGEYRPKQGFDVALHVRDAAEAPRVFDALAHGGRVETPLSEMAWSSAFGMLRISDRRHRFERHANDRSRLTRLRQTASRAGTP